MNPAAMRDHTKGRLASHASHRRARPARLPDRGLPGRDLFYAQLQ